MYSVLALLYSPGFSYLLGVVSPYIYVPCELAKPHGFASFTVTHFIHSTFCCNVHRSLAICYSCHLDLTIPVRVGLNSVL